MRFPSMMVVLFSLSLSFPPCLQSHEKCVVTGLYCRLKFCFALQEKHAQFKSPATYFKRCMLEQAPVLVIAILPQRLVTP